MVTTTRAGWGRAVLAVGLAAALVAGCSGTDDNDAAVNSAAPETTAFDGDVPTGEADEAGGGASGETALAVDTQAIAAARDIVRTGSMQLTVDDAEDAAADITRIAADAGGFVASEEARVRDDEVDITIRVPADSFEDVRARVGDLGDVEEQTVDAQDVTAQVVDIDSRVASLERSVERLQGLLSQAGDVGQLATVEGELARRETELEALQGQQRVLADQVALGTLDVHLAEEQAVTLSEDTPGFLDGLHTGWVALVYGGRVALTALGFALPFLVPAALALAVFRWLHRRRSGPPTPAEQTPQ
jgi:Domain of unknown function (DUF4349)